MLRTTLFLALVASATATAANYKPKHNGGESRHTGPVNNKYQGKNDQLAGNTDYTDASPNPTGSSHGGRDPRREPHVSWSGDLDPKSRALQGTVTIRPGMDARGLKGWKLYPTGDGTYAGRKALKFADGSGSTAQDPQYTHDLSAATQCGTACLNNSGYSPTCSGTNCNDKKTVVAHDGTTTVVTRDRVTIMPGDSGEFYISRVQNQVCEFGTGYTPSTKYTKTTGTLSGKTVQTFRADPAASILPVPPKKADRTCQGDTSEDTYRTGQLYAASEEFTISFPAEGFLTLVLHEFGTVGTTLKRTGGTTHSYKEKASLDKATEILDGDSLLWQSGAETPTGRGWTFVYQPNYPEVEVKGQMANGASGFVVVGQYDSGATGEDTDNTRYVETRDWMVPNVTCTPTTMHCPIPNVWAHVDYTTPSMYPEPAEGSCEQVKTGTRTADKFGYCSDKTDTNSRWYARGIYSSTTLPGTSASGDNEEDNGQAFADDTFGVKHDNWAGNCGDAHSYFWFEKIACGSTRTFHTDGRSLIEDNVVLSPTWENIKDILAKYYTTKKPLKGAADSVGFTFINADYHVAPVLPPKVECSCLAAMDAYASLLSVQSKTPTPGAPVTLDPEVLNTGSSKIVATLRMYHDPTYSLTATSDSVMPIVVSRFYLEVSTKFTRNRITISDCMASNQEKLLNDSTKALEPRKKYCDNSTFDTRTETSPAGVTHMDRVSMKKFKFHTTTDVFMQCKIRACAAQPCGTCQSSSSRQLAASPDLSPVEGEMFAPPTKIRVSQFDKNALVFAAQEYSGPVPAPPSTIPNSAIRSSQQKPIGSAPATAQPIQVASQVTLPLTPSWANENRVAVANTLRSALGLSAKEDLVITSISVARRLDVGRELQSSSVKIDFVVGVSSVSRATQTSSLLEGLAVGRNVASFTAILNENLRARGKASVEIAPQQVGFAPAQITRAAGSDNDLSSSTSDFAGLISLAFGSSQQAARAGGSPSSVKKQNAPNSNLLLIVLLVAVAGGALFFLTSRASKSAAPTSTAPDFAPSGYAAKVAHMNEEAL